jgi:hypothetical protein
VIVSTIYAAYNCFQLPGGCRIYLFQDNKFLITNNHLKMRRDIFQIYLGPNNLTSEEASKVLDKLNSFNSVAEIMSIIDMYAEPGVFGNRIAQRILNTKAQLGKFQDLNQVATVPGIGCKRFTIILSALSDHA